MHWRDGESFIYKPSWEHASYLVYIQKCSTSFWTCSSSVWMLRTVWCVRGWPSTSARSLRRHEIRNTKTETLPPTRSLVSLLSNFVCAEIVPKTNTYTLSCILLCSKDREEVNSVDHTCSSVWTQFITPSTWRSSQRLSWRRRSLSSSTSHPDRSIRSLNRVLLASMCWLVMRWGHVYFPVISCSRSTKVAC